MEPLLRQAVTEKQLIGVVFFCSWLFFLSPSFPSSPFNGPWSQELLRPDSIYFIYSLLQDTLPPKLKRAVVGELGLK